MTSAKVGTPACDIYVSAGSNIDPVRHLRFACRELGERFGPLALSSVYQTASIGFDGDDFLNMVISFSTDSRLEEVVAELIRLERAAGRDGDTDRFSARTLDLDLLLYGDRVSDGPPVRLPRSDITEYAFVLAPLAELVPELLHPVTGETMQDLWMRFDRSRQSIRRLSGIYQPMLRPPSTAMI
jgi:2-amino-4-hydroxy-6-hydroxymethyldihydropteridine diphosphokinase